MSGNCLRSWGRACLPAALCIAWSLVSCASPSLPGVVSPTPPLILIESSPTPLPPVPSASIPPQKPSTPTPVPADQVCSPFAGLAVIDLPGAVSNPYHPPGPGRDDPHAGIDLADRSPGAQIALAGRTVQAALAGRVAMILHDRFPFGNAVLVETPLDESSVALSTALPTPAPTVAFIPALTCPAGLTPALEETGARLLYLLYAHLQASPELHSGDAVSCGQSLGKVGDSGNALNPHLHLEARIGPSGLRLDSMAHYDPGATPQEMANYCLWSVSGLFQTVNPLDVLVR